MYSKSICFGLRETNPLEPYFTTECERIYATGFRHIRTNILLYSDQTTGATARDLVRTKVTTWLGLHSDTTAIIGYNLTQNVVGTIDLETYVQTTAHDALISLATWVATLSTDYQKRINIQMSSEDDEAVVAGDRTNYRTYMTTTMATDVKAVAPLSETSLCIRHDYISGYLTGGRGSVDVIFENKYSEEDDFEDHVKAGITAFGADHFAIGECGYFHETEGYNHYNGDNEYYARMMWWTTYVGHKYRIKIYPFAYDVGADSTTIGSNQSKFSIRLTDDTFRQSWQAITAKREPYAAISTPR